MRPHLSRLLRWTVVLAAAAAVFLAVFKATPPGGGSVTEAAPPEDVTVQTDFGPLGPADRDLLAKVRQAGLWETPTGQQMQQRASSQIVRDVGGLIATEHIELDAIVREAAQQVGAEIPSQPNEQQQAWMAEISEASASDYDRVAINLLRGAHGKVLPAIAQVRSGTRNELIRDFATTAAQFVTRHHEYLESTGLVDFAALPEPASPPAPAPAQPAPAPVAAAPVAAAPAPVAAPPALAPPPAPANPAPGSGAADGSGSSPYPVANATPAEPGAAEPSPASSPLLWLIVSAVLAVGAVLGAGGLIGMMLHSGDRRRRRPEPGRTSHPGPHRPPPRRPAPPSWRSGQPGWAPHGRPPPHPRPGGPYPAPPEWQARRGRDRLQAMLAIALAAGLVASLLFATGEGSSGDTAAADVALGSQTAGSVGHDHGGGIDNVAAARGDRGDGRGGNRRGGNGQDSNGQDSNGQDSNGQDSNGQDSNGQNNNGQNNNGQNNNGQNNNEQNNNGQNNNGLDTLGQDCGNSDLQPHNGFQDAPRCVNTAFGEVSAAEQNPSLLITDAPQRVNAGQPFTMEVSTRNLVRDRFLAAAEGGYYLERSDLNEQGLQRGHVHTACRMLDSTAVAPNPNVEPAAFVATEDGRGGVRPDVVQVRIPGLPERGIAQCAAWAGDGSHRTPMMQRANQTPAFDAVRVVVQ